jgi:GT2 family glycosyltransferase
MKLSVIIVTYNSESVIFDCLNSISSFNDIGQELEVIIVDNSKIDSLQSKLNADNNYGFLLRYTHNPKNGGFGQGNNIGVKLCSGDIVLFLNPDTILIEPVFGTLVSTMKNPSVSLAGFRLVDRDGNDNDSVGLLPQLNYLFIPRRILNFLVIDLNVMTSFVYPWGAALAIRKNDFIDYGQFDEKMFLCNEEPDLTLRVSKGNTKIINSRIVHLEGHTTSVHAHRFKAWLESTEYYLNKHGFSYRRFIYTFIFRNYSKKILKRMLGRNSDKERNVHILLLEELKRHSEK